MRPRCEGAHERVQVGTPVGPTARTESDASPNGCVGPSPRGGGTSTSKTREDIPLAERWKGLDLRLLPIDEVDVRILSRLRDNARLSNVDIARDLGVSEATVRRRIQTLEGKGIIQGYSCYLNYHLIENPVKAYVHLSLEPPRRESVVGRIVAHPRAIAVYRVTGEHDVLAVMFFVDMSELHDFLDHYLQLDGIREVRTQIVMSPYKGVPWTGV